jgi:hypothetical protein
MLAGVLAVQAAPAGAQAAAPESPPGETITWGPDTKPSIINPSVNTSLSAWESFKKRTGSRPFQDKMLDDPILKGAIDVHAHYGPDVYRRQWDVFEIARRAQERGMRGIVIKSHFEPSANLASITRKYAAPNLEVWGALVLNSTVGGINPMAVRAFAENEGGATAKVVWMPTHDAEHEVKVQHETRPYVRVSDNGELLPQVYEVLDLIKHYNLTLGTGHVSAEEMLKIVAAAKERGISGIIITHPGLGAMVTDPSIEQLQQAVAMGGYAEVVVTMLTSKSRNKTIAMMRAVGPAHLIVSSDSGLVGGENHTDAIVIAAKILREEGFSETELDLMFKVNPAKVLGLPVQ